MRGSLIPIKVIECDKLHNWIKTLLGQMFISVSQNIGITSAAINKVSKKRVC